MAAISTGDLCKRINVTVSPEHLKNIGCAPAVRPDGKRAGVFWLESDIPQICHALALQLTATAEAEQAKLDADEDI